MKKAFYERVLSVITWLCEEIGPAPESGNWSMAFTKVRIGGISIEGDITMVKLEMGQQVGISAGEFKNRQGGEAKIQAGSAEWSVSATDVDGNESDDLTIEVNPNHETRATLKHQGDTELTGLVTFRADGDTDADEEAPIIGTLPVVVDSLNAVTFEIVAGTPHDTGHEPPVEGEPTPPEPDPETPPAPDPTEPPVEGEPSPPILPPSEEEPPV